MKHQTPWDHPDQSIQGFHSLEAEVCNISDEVAYNNHDLDDGLRAGLLQEDLLEKDVTLWKEAKSQIEKTYTNLSGRHRKTLINSYLISSQVQDVYYQTLKNIQETGIQTIQDVQEMKKEIVSFSDEMKEKNSELRRYLFKHFYFHSDVYRMNQKGQRIIKDIFEIFMDDLYLLPERYQEKIKENQSKERVICDYIAGMTDVYAKREHDQLLK